MGNKYYYDDFNIYLNGEPIAERHKQGDTLTLYYNKAEHLEAVQEIAEKNNLGITLLESAPLFGQKGGKQ